MEKMTTLLIDFLVVQICRSVILIYPTLKKQGVKIDCGNYVFQIANSEVEVPRLRSLRSRRIDTDVDGKEKN